jgi:hypothetical protein
MLLGVQFTFLPDPVDMGFVGTGTAVGGVLAGLWAYLRGLPLDEGATQAANGALAIGVAACAVWIMGMMGLELE